MLPLQSLFLQIEKNKDTSDDNDENNDDSDENENDDDDDGEDDNEKEDNEGQAMIVHVNADNKVTGVVTPVRALILQKTLAHKTIGPPS